MYVNPSGYKKCDTGVEKDKGNISDETRVVVLLVIELVIVEEIIY